MASLPSPTQVSGKHNAIYEAYYRQVDPKGIGTIEAMDAAKFLKKSGLSDVVLSRIWDLSDPNGRGYLDKSGLFVALKLVSLAQAGNDINLRNILNDTNAPKVGEMPKIIPQSIQSVPASNTDWSMKPMDKLKYEKLFESLQPVQGLIPGNKVKGVLMDSKLPLETLGKIWDLADQDKDGSLDKHEFIVAMHLVYQALEKRAVPSSLPPELQRSNEICKNSIEDIGFVANFPKEMAPPPVPPLPVSIPPAIPSLSRVPPTIPNMPLIPPAPIIQPVSDWVVTPQEKARYDEIFAKSDLDKDGLVSGLEIKDVFLQSGVAQNCLAHIWALCDTNQSGKLTSDQFALALWLVERKKMGIEPPQILAPNMIPPTLRDSAVESTIPQAEPQPTYSNPELEMIAKEIEEMAKERRILETEVAQKEADIRIKSGEVRSLQSELDTLAATLKQLENQKGEAQKRLDDLKAQQKNLDDVLNSINQEIFLQRQQVNKIREQCQKQEATIKEQESELDSKRSELQKFKDEENSLEKEYDNSMKELEGLTKQLQDTQLQISQVKAMVSQLQETQRQMNDSLAVCKTAIELEDPTLVSDYSLKLEPDFREAENVLKEKEIPKKDPFNEVSDDFGATSNTFGSDPFKSNGFSSDPFSNSNGTHATGFDDNFGGHGAGFDDSFGGGFHEKPTDPFAAVSDPFSDKTVQNAPIDSNKNQFENDPFAILHAPTSASQILSPNTAQKSGPPPRPESPSPALPPKKAKQPPPRPAPPRPMQGPTPTKPLPSNGGFGDSSSSGFADFADFDNKKVADFSEDPFKDYRYEDPFSIKDPFTDEDIEVEDPFTDQISSVPVNSKKLTNSNNNYSIGNHTIGASKQNIEPNDLIKNKINKSFDKTTNNIASIATSMKSFHLADRSKGTSGATKNEKVNANVDDETDFANFDAFSRETTETVTTTASSGTDFFEAFNNNFNKNTNSSNVVFDAFGGDTNTETATSYNKNTISNAFNDNFTENFSKLKDTKNVKSRTGNNEINQNFAKFDAFNEKTDFSSHFDAFNKNNKNNLSNHPVKVKEKFSDDYSQAEKFDSDLEAVLKRSLVDQ